MELRINRVRINRSRPVIMTEPNKDSFACKLRHFKSHVLSTLLNETLRLITHGRINASLKLNVASCVLSYNRRQNGGAKKHDSLRDVLCIC